MQLCFGMVAQDKLNIDHRGGPGFFQGGGALLGMAYLTDDVNKF